MTRPNASINRVYLYRQTSPILFIPWIWTQFFASAISWALIALYSVWSWNSTLFWIPTIATGAFFVLVPFQESQVPMIGVLELVTQNIDDFINDNISPIIGDIFYIFQPGCWGYNFLWDGTVAIFRIALYDPIKLLIASSGLPVDPFKAFITQTLSANSFPLTTEIDTSSAPDWIVGPCGRSSTSSIDHPVVKCGRTDHPLLDGSRRIDKNDPTTRFLIRWLQRHQHGRGALDTVENSHIVRMTMPASLLDEWTHPRTPHEKRRAISEQLLRQAMDQSILLEDQTLLWTADDDYTDDGDRPNGSPWARVFEVPHGGSMDHMGLVRLDTIPDLARIYGKDRVPTTLRVPAGSTAFRFLADDKGTRDLTFTVFQVIAQVLCDFLDTIVSVLVQLWEIALVVAKFLFQNLSVFFSNAIEFVAAVFTTIFREYLNLKCMKFDNIEVFAISVLDCICGPLTQAVQNLGGNIFTYFNYERPDDISELPQAMLSCVGLGCLNVSTINGFKAFATQLLLNCMQLPAPVVCCVIEPTNCFINTVMELTQCPCAHTINVTPPGCGYVTNSGTNWIKCIVIWIMNNVLEPAVPGTVSACEVTECIDIGDVATKFMECIAFSILKVDGFIDALIPIIKDILDALTGGDIPDLDELDFFREVEPDVIDSPRRRREAASALDEMPWMQDYVSRQQQQQQQQQSPRHGDSSDTSVVVSISEGEAKGGAALLKNLSTATSEQRLRYLTLAVRNGTSYQNLTELFTSEELQLLLKYGNQGIDSLLRMQARASRRQDLAFYRGQQPSESDVDAWVQRHSGASATPLRFQDAAGVQQLSYMVGEKSRSRHRAKIQVHVNRRLYNNPYIREMAWRAVEIARDLTDFAEFRMFGPDPFALPPEDADPERDPRVHTARYVDETMGHNHAYAFYQQAAVDSPYYAGLYKMLFQLGVADAEASRTTSNDTSTVDADGDEDIDAVWQAMGSHGDNPLFHMGRLMAASRQLLYAYSVVLKEVWWESDTYSFHFPNYRQIRNLMMQTHLPAYMDDMRAAAVGILRTKSMEAREILQQEALRYADDVEQQGPEIANLHHGGVTRSYSFLVQTDVAFRTVITRLLSPKHLDPMLAELSTRSPLHARYCDRMQRRVESLRDASEHGEYLDLTQKIVAWRKRQTGTMPLAGTDQVINRPLAEFALDPDFHPDAGNRSLVPGERVRFADGHMGTYLGTVGSMVAANPTRAIGSAGGAVPLGISPRAVQIAAVLSAFKDVIVFVASNWELIATAFATAVESPWGRVFWETWLTFIYNRIIRPLYSEGLRGIFGSLSQILDLVKDFSILNVNILFFLVNELFRYVLCFAWVALILTTIFLPVYIIGGLLTFNMITPALTIVAVPLAAVAIMFPYCPPEQVLIDNVMQQTPPKYFDDIIQCFGDPDITSIQIGKNVYNGICSVKTDCPGNAPCICENKGGQYSSAFAAFVDDTACGTVAAPTGQCLCWPKIDCQFLFGRIGTNRLFDVDCAAEYGYHLNDITWYQTSSWFTIFFNAYRNFWTSLRYVTRILTQARSLNPLLFMVFITIGFLILFYASVYAGIVVIALTMGYEYGLPLWKNLVISHIIPGLERVSGSFWPISLLSSWWLEFLRFSNHSDAVPLGTPGSSEGTCWFFNLASFVGGGAVAFWFWATVLALLWYGFGPIIWFVFNNLMVPVRMAYAPFWRAWQQSRMARHFAKAKRMIRKSIPQWAVRGADTAGNVLLHVGSRLADAIPDAPNTWLTRQVNQYYPDPTEAWKTRLLGPDYRPVYIHGAFPGYGAGHLEYETDPQVVPVNSGAAAAAAPGNPIRIVRRRRPQGNTTVPPSGRGAANVEGLRIQPAGTAEEPQNETETQRHDKHQ